MKKLDITFFCIAAISFIAYGLLLLITGDGLPCVIHEYTGFYCPGCGISRMLISLSKFEIYQAFRFNPFIFLLLILVSIFMSVEIISFIKNKKFFKVPNYIYITLIVGLIAFGVLRNIPAFSYLLPTIVK